MDVMLHAMQYRFCKPKTLQADCPPLLEPELWQTSNHVIEAKNSADYWQVLSCINDRLSAWIPPAQSYDNRENIEFMFIVHKCTPDRDK